MTDRNDRNAEMYRLCVLLFGCVGIPSMYGWVMGDQYKCLVICSGSRNKFLDMSVYARGRDVYGKALRGSSILPRLLPPVRERLMFTMA